MVGGKEFLQLIATIPTFVDLGHELLVLTQVRITEAFFAPIARTGTLNSNLIDLVIAEIDNGTLEIFGFRIRVQFVFQILCGLRAQQFGLLFLERGFFSFYTVGFELGLSFILLEGDFLNFFFHFYEQFVLSLVKRFLGTQAQTFASCGERPAAG